VVLAADAHLSGGLVVVGDRDGDALDQRRRQRHGRSWGRKVAFAGGLDLGLGRVNGNAVSDWRVCADPDRCQFAFRFRTEQLALSIKLRRQSFRTKQFQPIHVCNLSHHAPITILQSLKEELKQLKRTCSP
jgi:hypothetical protein